jgi:hypothetical protein
VTTSCMPIPTPMNVAKIITRCQGCETCEIKANPIPFKTPVKLKTRRGRYQSLTRPATRTKTPTTKNAIATQLDSNVRDQPNSISNSLKNTPKENIRPITVNWVKKAPVKTVKRDKLSPFGAKIRPSMQNGLKYRELFILKDWGDGI